MYASRQYLTRERNAAGTGGGPHISAKKAVRLHPVLQLQRTSGNREIARLIQALQRRPQKRGSSPERDRRESAPVARAAAAGSRAEGAQGTQATDEGQPDWSAPIEQVADTRSEPAFRTESEPVAVQRQAAGVVAATFPTFPQVRWNATVSNAMWAAWAQTLRAATATERREQGFWVQWNSTTIRNANGDMRVVGAVVAPPIGPAVTASVQLGARPADDGDWVTVASFHTHTPTRFRTVGRVVGPSGDDHAADTNDNVTGLVYDYKAVAGGAIPAGHPTWSDAQVYHSGPNARV